jgi:type IV secretion system protein VirD4
MDFKYNILKHPNVALTADGKAEPYQHGEVTASVAVVDYLDINPKEIDDDYGETTYELLSDEDFEV